MNYPRYTVVLYALFNLVYHGILPQSTGISYRLCYKFHFLFAVGIKFINEKKYRILTTNISKDVVLRQMKILEKFRTVHKQSQKK